jgi:hypothetical protein
VTSGLTGVLPPRGELDLDGGGASGQNEGLSGRKAAQLFDGQGREPLTTDASGIAAGAGAAGDQRPVDVAGEAADALQVLGVG